MICVFPRGALLTCTQRDCSNDERSGRSLYFTLFVFVIRSEEIHSLPFFGLVLLCTFGEDANLPFTVMQVDNCSGFYFLELKYNPLANEKRAFSLFKKV